MIKFNIISVRRMKALRSNIRVCAVSAVVCSPILLVVIGCSGGADKEITSTRPYANLIGAEYQVVADDLYAYGVYNDWPDKTLTWITLIPGVGIGGREIAFRRHVPRGGIIRILSAWERWVLFGSRVYYLVSIQNSDLPKSVPIRLQLMRGNEAGGANLNPSVYMGFQRATEP